MSLATTVATAIEKVNELMDLVKGQYNKWDGQVKAKISELEDWKSNFENAGYGLKKYKNFIGSRRDYRKAVIPLVELTDGDGTRKSAFSYTAGKFEFIRTNGCCIQSPIVIDIKAIKAYNSENMNLFSLHISSDYVKPCVFLLDGKKYGGLHIYYNVQSHGLFFDGWSNCSKLGYYDYIDVRGDDGAGVTNQEINDSLVIIE
jgi:hypothetical protein